MTSFGGGHDSKSGPCHQLQRDGGSDGGSDGDRFGMGCRSDGDRFGMGCRSDGKAMGMGGVGTGMGGVGG